MGKARPVLIALVGVVIGAAVVTAVMTRAGRGRGWADVAVDRATFSGDRSSVWVLAEEYQSPSCYEHSVRVDRNDTRWAVHLRARRTSTWCTLEGCAPDEPGNWGSVAPPPARTSVRAGCPPWFRLPLDEPAPTDVELEIAR